jgi:hypothetical protein
MKVLLDRKWAMPNKNTFSISPILDFIYRHKHDGLWIDPFANSNKLANITNDLDPQYDTDYHLDAIDFLRQFDSGSIDGVLYDPPYSSRQVSESYKSLGYSVNMETTQGAYWSKLKKEINRIVKPNGRVLSFAWNSGGIGSKYGFGLVEVLLVAHGGAHNDTICTAEIKTTSLFDEAE